MKRILFLLSAVIVLLTSCEGPAGRDGLDGNGVNMIVGNYTIRSNDWQLIDGANELNSFYQAEVVIPQLTRLVYERGNVFCYMYQTIDGTEVQTPLPFSLPVGVETNSGEELWTEIYTYDFTPGSIMFYMMYDDFFTGKGRPATTEFRVVLSW